MIENILLLLVLLQVKHWYVDFVNQSNEEVASKGIYGDQLGINHSLKHGLGTMIAIMLITGPQYMFYILMLGLLDTVVHYHIDWIKMNYVNRDITTQQFWNHPGFDQMAHQLTYLFIAYSIS